MGRTKRSPQAYLILLLVLCLINTALSSPGYRYTQQKTNLQQPVNSIADDQQPLSPNPYTAPALLDALDVLQAEYFEVWQGIWPDSIDWTSAVIGTYLSGALSTLSSSFASLPSSKEGENIINKYFSQLVASYFGQNAFSLRQQAYDDMLWVVLGWLESIKFINAHSETHYPSEAGTEWHGRQWIPAFAHRARVFWELASQGWDTKLCDGGMIWSPYLTPYKNAITNELYIAASVSMYLQFPGDENASPFGFLGPHESSSHLTTAMEKEEAPAHDPKYLAAAIEAYKWLEYSNMTDSRGLYVDGYHVSGGEETNNTKCDARNEMVYTYNQGVLLTGQRGLYEATGSRPYLDDGHRLISDVIAATGWDLSQNAVPGEDYLDESELGKWHGLGRSGILEEACDADAYCSQDSQTFKGIFFHHLTTFCQPLSDHLTLPGKVYKSTGSVNDIEQVRKLHARECKKYQGWIRHNAHGALTTRDSKGKFGSWWGAPPHSNKIPRAEVVLADNAVDYRNGRVPGKWEQRQDRHQEVVNDGVVGDTEGDIRAKDLNDRGRGRTVETQGGGVSVIRALLELVDMES